MQPHWSLKTERSWCQSGFRKSFAIGTIILHFPDLHLLSTSHSLWPWPWPWPWPCRDYRRIFLQIYANATFPTPLAFLLCFWILTRRRVSLSKIFQYQGADLGVAGPRVNTIQGGVHEWKIRCQALEEMHTSEGLRGLNLISFLINPTLLLKVPHFLLPSVLPSCFPSTHLPCTRQLTSWVYILIWKLDLLWLVWLGGVSTGLRTEGSPVRIRVKAYAWVADQSPVGACGSSQWMCLSCVDVSLPLSLPPFPSFRDVKN